MDIRSVFIFSIFILIPVQGQVVDNMLDDVILIGDHNDGAVCRMNISNNYSFVYTVFSSWIYPYDIDYDPVGHVMYWISLQRQINSGSLFGNGKRNVSLLNSVANTGGIAVDSVSRLLFYTDMEHDIITAVSLDDHFQKTVINSGLGKPRAIVTDPINGKIYWADSECPAKIEKSNYDGTNRRELVNTGLSSPYGLALDINAGVLYWCEIDTFTIERANVDGSNRSLIYHEQITVSGCSIALHHSYLYFTTWWSRYGLMRIGTDGRGVISVASSGDILTLAIHVYLNGRLGLNGCSNARGGCSHLCFPLPGGNKGCACPNFMTLQADGKTCRHDDLIIASSGGRDLLYIRIDTNYSYVTLPVRHWVYAYDLDYDITDGVIYWVNRLNEICSGSIFAMNEKFVGYLNRNVKSHGIAVDSISRLLFYTDMKNGIISAISLQDYSQKTVISSGLVSPGAIVIDPINGTIYWVDWGSPAKIETSNYNGTNRQEVVNSGLTSPFCLDVDINAGVLYWCEIGIFKIERANVDGSNRSLIYQEQITIEGCSIALYHSYLYFTTWSFRNDIMRIGTDGSGLISIASSANMYPEAIHVHKHGYIGINGCSEGRGGCSHFCFPLPGGSNVCACPDVMTLQPDGKTCEIGFNASCIEVYGMCGKHMTSSGIRARVLTQLGQTTYPYNYRTDESDIYIYTKDTDNYSFDSFPIQNVSKPYDFNFDPDAIYMPALDYGQFIYSSRYGNNLTALQGFHKYVDDCFDYSCKNGGNWTKINGFYTCNCPLGWQGKTCSTDINECLDFPCKNGGNCTNINGSYTCKCPIGWQGKNCSKGSTKKPTILRAVVGSLAGVHVIVALLIVCVCTQQARRMRRRKILKSDDI